MEVDLQRESGGPRLLLHQLDKPTRNMRRITSFILLLSPLAGKREVRFFPKDTLGHHQQKEKRREKLFTDKSWSLEVKGEGGGGGKTILLKFIFKKRKNKKKPRVWKYAIFSLPCSCLHIPQPILHTQSEILLPFFYHYGWMKKIFCLVFICCSYLYATFQLPPPPRPWANCIRHCKIFNFPAVLIESISQDSQIIT